MLIVPLALDCVDSCNFVFYLNWHSLVYCFGVSAPLPLRRKKIFLFQI